MKMTVIGDSVAWGQGLLTPHKFANLVALGCGASTAGNDFMLAHSGATIGISNPAPTTSIDPEIPAPSPMIFDQVDHVQSPETVDLVLIVGGINDVNITTIFNPLTNLADLRKATLQFCYTDMKSLLTKALNTFSKPTVQIRVIGYYPIFSPVSNPMPGAAGDPLVHFLGNFNMGFPQTLDRNLILGALSDRAMQFWSDSTIYIQKVVDELANNNLVFVNPNFAPDNALFTSNCLLWGFGNDFGPEDEVAAQREQACAIQYPPVPQFFANELCHLASVGHPNVMGAQAISRAILSTL